jgi:hypothetical protein
MVLSLPMAVVGAALIIHGLRSGRAREYVKG